MNTYTNGGEDAQILQEGTQGGDKGGSRLDSYSHYNSPPTRCLKTTDMYSLTVLEARSLKSVSMGAIVLMGPHSLQRLQGRSCFWPLPASGGRSAP